MKIAGIQWDGGNWPKCGKHGVSRNEIEQAFNNMKIRSRDPNSAEDRFRTVYKTAEGRFVYIVFTHRKVDGSTFLRPISARYMHEKEVKQYEQIEKETVAYTQDR